MGLIKVIKIDNGLVDIEKKKKWRIFSGVWYLIENWDFL